MDRTIKIIKVEDAVGTVLAHDMTRIVPGTSKGVGFKRGHVVRPEDIPGLLAIGKRHVYVLEPGEDRLHEDDAARRIARALCGDNLEFSDPSEGKSRITSTITGLLQIDVAALGAVNSIGEIIVATLKNGLPCRPGQVIAATRIIPLLIGRERIEALEGLAAAAAPVLQVRPYTRRRVGLVVTGSEVAEGLIEDASDRFIVAKLADYGATLVGKLVVSDDAARIAQAILELEAAGAEVILTSGGLSVDPDDVTRQGVRASGAEIVSYGAPVLPGAMFLNARRGETLILGLPACVFYFARTVYDLMLPRFLAGVPPTAAEVAAMGHGGLCLECETCHFPACAFGR